MINLEFSSQNINLENKKLSAIFSADNFVYACFDEGGNMLSYVGNNKASDFADITEKFSPENIKVAVKTTHFGHFGDQKRIPFEQHKLVLDKMTAQDIWAAYETPFTPESQKTRHFSTLLHHHYLLKRNEIFHIHFDKNQMHFYLQTNGELILYNIYPFEAVGDLVYYHAFISQSFDLDTQNKDLYLSGMIEFNSTAHQALAPFHNNIKFVDFPFGNIITDRTDLKPYHFFDHFINMQCA